MNKRFAQIITDSTDPLTGRVDRARLFSALEADANDPTAAIFDAAAFTFEMLEELKSSIPLTITERMKKHLEYLEGSQRTYANKLDDAASMTANTSRELRKWSEQFWALAITEARKQAEAGRIGGITASANATNATKEAERAVRECSRKLSEGRMEIAETWSQLLEEARRIAQRIRTASIILLLIAFAVGILVGAGISRVSW
jgi:thiol:disulfide interchange protein